MTAILYAADVLLIDMSTINAIQDIQRGVGKAILNVPRSTANEVVVLELGLRPVLLKVLSLKINFYLSSNQTTKLCLQLLEESGDSEFIKNYDSSKTFWSFHRNSGHIEGKIVSNIHSAIFRKPSLSTLPLSVSLWKPSPHLSEGLWSTYLIAQILTRILLHMIPQVG